MSFLSCFTLPNIHITTPIQIIRDDTQQNHSTFLAPEVRKVAATSLGESSTFLAPEVRKVAAIPGGESSSMDGHSSGSNGLESMQELIAKCQTKIEELEKRIDELDTKLTQSEDRNDLFKEGLTHLRHQVVNMGSRLPPAPISVPKELDLIYIPAVGKERFTQTSCLAAIPEEESRQKVEEDKTEEVTTPLSVAPGALQPSASLPVQKETVTEVYHPEDEIAYALHKEKITEAKVLGGIVSFATKKRNNKKK